MDHPFVHFRDLLGMNAEMQIAFAEAVYGVSKFSDSPLGLSLQDINEVSLVQQFPLGATMELADDSKFVYAKAGGTLNTDMGAKCFNTQHVSYGILAATSLIGSKNLSITVGATDGVLANGAIAADEMKGGYVVVFPHTSNTFVRRISGNTPVAAGGGISILTLDIPIPCTVDITTDHAEAICSPYADVRTGIENTKSVVGIPTMPATVGQYLWLMKKGVGWLSPQAAVSVGNNNREVVFRHDGSLDIHSVTDANVVWAQHAGWVIANAAGGGQGAPFVMFNI